MSRWTIEKDGTGIEKSGSGIERSGTGIEKSGTGIEKSGTGIEKSGTGIQRICIACIMAFASFAGNLQAENLSPAGSLQVVVDRNRNHIAVSWVFDGSVFSGVTAMSSSFAKVHLTEVSLWADRDSVQVTGNGTGSSKLVTGNGTGSSTLVTGNGTGSSKQVTGNGTGSSTLVTGNGTGSSVSVTGNGTGSSILVTGNGTGDATHVTGNGTGSSFLVAGSSSGGDAIAITPPDGTGLAMEISLHCGTANVTVLDATFAPVVSFENVTVVGDTGLCGGSTGGHLTDPGFDFRSN